jgi:hypothetical protein
MPDHEPADDDDESGFPWGFDQEGSLGNEDED